MTTEMKHSALFTWDNGDSSVGIGPGFGEDTGATTTFGPFRIQWLFIVEEDKPVAEWPLDDIQLQYVFDHDKGDKDWMHLAQGSEVKYHVTRGNRNRDMLVQMNIMPPEYWRQLHPRRPMVVGDIPGLTEVVQRSYDEFIKEQNRVNALIDYYDEDIARQSD